MGLRGVGVGVAGFGVVFLPGSIFTSCAATRSGRVVSAPSPTPINSNAQVVKKVVFIAFVAPPVDDADLENERLVAFDLAADDHFEIGCPRFIPKKFRARFASRRV